MNSEHILLAMTDIDDSHIIAALHRLEGQPECRPARRGRRALTRGLALAAALILLLAVGFGSALAVSPELRELVYQYFSVEEPEVVTKPDFDGNASTGDIAVEPEKEDIGGIIERTVVQVQADGYASTGVYLLCTDEVVECCGNHYDAFCEQDGALVKLEEHTLSLDETVLGTPLHMTWDWVEHNGYVVITHQESDAGYWLESYKGGPKEALVYVYCRNSEEESIRYPVLVDLETGELTDFLAGIGVEHLPEIRRAAFSADRSKVLLWCVDGGEQTDHFYLADLTTGVLQDVAELSGGAVDDCVLTDTTLTCWTRGWVKGVFATVAWAFDLNTMERRELFFSEEILSISGVAARAGNHFAGSPYAFGEGADGSFYVVDLTTGVQTIIEGFHRTEYGFRYLPSPDGSKLLIYTETGGGNLRYDSIGILDFRSKQYTAFARESVTDISEATMKWFDNDSIVVSTRTENDMRSYYIYRLVE